MSIIQCMRFWDAYAVGHTGSIFFIQMNKYGIKPFCLMDKQVNTEDLLNVYFSKSN